MKYLYGPVNSRRLGLSLGVTLTLYKVCTFNCVYCQLGRTIATTKERKDYIPIEEVINELRLWLQYNKPQVSQLNYITLSGLGEPTLNLKIGQLIPQIKNLTNTAVAVITNSSLLNLPAVRQDLLQADLIIPSLDAVTAFRFTKIDRPHPEIKIEEIIEGLISLRKEFKGKIWLEVMLAKGVNDDIRHMRKFEEVIDKINPDKIHLNSPLRTTAETNILPVKRKKLEEIKELFGEKCEII